MRKGLLPAPCVVAMTVTATNSPFEGGRALKNDPVDHFSEGARMQGKGDVR